MATRSKRLRKKLRLGEFQELGFQLHAKTVTDIDEEKLWDLFIGQAIEANGLLFGGGVGREINGFVTVGGRGSTSEEHRQTLAAWLEMQPEILEFEVGPLVDAWYEA